MRTEKSRLQRSILPQYASSSPYADPARRWSLPSPEPFPAPDHNSLVAPAPPRQWLLSPVDDLLAERVNSRRVLRVRSPRVPAQWRFLHAYLLGPRSQAITRGGSRTGQSHEFARSHA